jgi:hypothetical protein
MSMTDKADESLLRSRWPILFFVIISILVFSYFIHVDDPNSGPGSGLGLAYGVTGFTIALFLASYKIRKSALGYKWGRMGAWLQTHIYLSVVCAVLILMHSGFKINFSLSGLFCALFMLVVASGAVGSIMYKIIPLSLSKYGREVLTTDDIQQKFQAILEEGDLLAEKTSDNFQHFYEDKIRPLLAYNGKNWRYLFNEERAVIHNCQEVFQGFKAIAPAEEVYDLNLLATLYVEKERLTFKWMKLDSLQSWLDFHIPLTLAMFTAALIHIFSMFYF